MRSNMVRVVLGVAVVVIAVVLLVVLKDDGNGGEETSVSTGAGDAEQTNSGPNGKVRKPAIPTILIRSGEPVGGVAELSFEAGDRIRFRIRSDVSDEVHVHGYDISKDAEAGGSVSFDFPATIEGLFEVELEQRGEQILELRVNP